MLWVDIYEAQTTVCTGSTFQVRPLPVGVRLLFGAVTPSALLAIDWKAVQQYVGHSWFTCNVEKKERSREKREAGESNS